MSKIKDDETGMNGAEWIKQYAEENGIDPISLRNAADDVCDSTNASDAEIAEIIKSHGLTYREFCRFSVVFIKTFENRLRN